MQRQQPSNEIESSVGDFGFLSDFFAKFDCILEILNNEPSEVIIVLRTDCNHSDIANLNKKVANEHSILNKGYSIIYTYDNGRIIDF